MPKIDPVYVWTAILVIAFLAEILTPSALISIWFFVGSLGAIIAALLGFGIPIQIAAFAFVSLLCLIMVRPFARKALRGNIEATNADRLIGQRYLLRKAIEEESDGPVKVNDVFWNVKTLDRTTVPAGTLVEILALDGAKLIVRPIKEEA